MIYYSSSDIRLSTLVIIYLLFIITGFVWALEGMRDEVRRGRVPPRNDEKWDRFISKVSSTSLSTHVLIS
jgi:hypothetical protein